MKKKEVKIAVVVTEKRINNHCGHYYFIGELVELIDDDDIDLDDESWQPCDICDLPDACADFGCAIEHGIRRKHLEDF